ncbi:hypothetical protein CJJ09_000063 [Candidozyma auris]|nr:hypothetical protein CJJ09_000063 [[Candida] auris]
MSSNNLEKTVSAEQHSLSDKQQSVHESETASKELHLVTSEDSVEFEKSRGVRRIENVRTMMLTAKNGKSIMVTFIVCLLIIAWVYSLDSSTTSSYAVPATSSFNRHSMISSVNIASSIIGSVVQPFQAKFSDITSRPLCFAVSLGFYTMGVIVAAASSTIGAYVVGSVCTAVGSNGVSFVRDIIVADLTDLKWRGVANALMTSPYIITVWFSGLIVEAILNHNWRWGYVVWESAIQMDAFGLILMGFGWALLLLPFSLQPYAKDGWGNPSLIAMLVVGPVLLVVFAIYEFFFAPFPLMPRRILYNKTFVSSVLINFIYLLADGVRSQYLTSILLVGKIGLTKTGPILVTPSRCPCVSLALSQVPPIELSSVTSG